MEKPPPYSPESQETPHQEYTPSSNTSYQQLPPDAPQQQAGDLLKKTDYGSTGYTPQEQSSPPSSFASSSQGQGYQQQGQGYQPQGQGYQPQGQGYQPQGQGYQPQGQGYQPQGQGYQPQGQGYQPQGQGYQQQGQGYQPQGQGYQPQVQGYQPQVQGYQPQGQGYQPQGQAYQQQGQGYQPQVQGYQPQGQGYQQQGQRYQPQGQGYQPQGQGYQPQGQGYQQQGQGYQFKGQGCQHQVNTQGYTSQNINSTTVHVTQNPQPGIATGVPPVVNTHLILSIIACVCFPAIGILAVVKSSEAQRLFMAGDYVGAMASARSARNLSIAGIICGLIAYTFCIIIVVIRVDTSE